MKKRILSALVATALCLFSCGKDDDNSSTSITPLLTALFI